MKRSLPTIGVAFLSVLASSCLTPMPMTRVNTVSKDPQFTPGRFRCALVIGVFPDLERRKLFEKEFAGRLRKHGETTIASYKFLPAVATATRPQVEALVKDHQVDMVFITRLVDRTTIQTEVAGYTTEVPADPLDGPTKYFDSASKEVTTPGYRVDQTVAVLETKVFDARTGAVVWTCRSDTLINGYLDDLIRDFAKVMTQALYGPG